VTQAKCVEDECGRFIERVVSAVSVGEMGALQPRTAGENQLAHGRRSFWSVALA
jgi:hypothetical protein